MLNDNYAAFMHNMFFGSFSGASNGIYAKDMKNVAGNTAKIYASMQLTYRKDIGAALYFPRCQNIVTNVVSSQGSTGYGVYFGSGSTPANKADITLESPITSGLEVSGKSTGCLNIAEGQYMVLGQYVLKNTTEAEINIYETGVFLPIQTATTSWCLVMVDRTVLTEPITIAPGESKLVTYKLTFNQTLNVE